MASGSERRPGRRRTAWAWAAAAWIYKDLEIEDLRNPAFGIERFPLKKRERFLTPEERQRVQAVIDAGLRIPAGRKGHLHIATVWPSETPRTGTTDENPAACQLLTHRRSSSHGSDEWPES